MPHHKIQNFYKIIYRYQGDENVRTTSFFYRNTEEFVKSNGGQCTYAAVMLDYDSAIHVVIHPE